MKTSKIFAPVLLFVCAASSINLALAQRQTSSPSGPPRLEDLVRPHPRPNQEKNQNDSKRQAEKSNQQKPSNPVMPPVLGPQK